MFGKRAASEPVFGKPPAGAPSAAGVKPAGGAVPPQSKFGARFSAKARMAS